MFYYLLINIFIFLNTFLFRRVTKDVVKMSDLRDCVVGSCRGVCIHVFFACVLCTSVVQKKSS